MKEALPHGMFGKWLKAEFAWKERLAQTFMNVAQQFGGISAIIADLNIESSAAYLLAVPSVPDDARALAIERAQAGEHITTVVANDIPASVRKKSQAKREIKGDASRFVDAVDRSDFRRTSGEWRSTRS